MKSFLQLAQDAQAELDARHSEIDKEAEKLAKKASLLASREAKIEDGEKELVLKVQELQDREERVSMREGVVNREQKAQEDRMAAETANRESELNLKKAKELNDDAVQKLAELSKRELALSEARKSYKAEVEMEVMKHIAFGK